MLEPHLCRSLFSGQGQWVVAGRHIMQAARDPLLGWTAFAGHECYVRQLRDMKATVRLDRLRADDLRAHTALRGRVLARTHAMSGDPAQIAGYLGHGDHLDRSLAAFANARADQIQSDHRVLIDPISRGGVRAIQGT